MEVEGTTPSQACRGIRQTAAIKSESTKKKKSLMKLQVFCFCSLVVVQSG